MESLHEEGVHKALYTAPFFGRMDDVPRKAREYGGVSYKLRSHDYTHLPIFDPTQTGDSTEEHTISNQNWWTFAFEPPTRSEASQWAALGGADEVSKRRVKAQKLSQVCFVPYFHGVFPSDALGRLKAQPRKMSMASNTREQGGP